MKSVYLEEQIHQSEDEPHLDTLPERCRVASREDLERLESGVSASVLLAAADESQAPVRIRYMGRTILAQPMDTRRFVREMAAHICFN